MSKQVKFSTVKKMVTKVTKAKEVILEKMSQKDKGRIVFEDVPSKVADAKGKQKVQNMFNMNGLNKLNVYRVSKCRKDNKYRISVYVDNYSVIEQEPEQKTEGQKETQRTGQVSPAGYPAGMRGPTRQYPSKYSHLN